MNERREWTADEVIASAVRGSGVSLTAYQRAFLCDRSPLRCVLKARQTGFSWLFALEALAEAIANGHFSIFVSMNRDEAAEKILYARSLYDDLPEEMRVPLEKAATYEIRFEGGGRLLSHACRAPRGKAGASLYLDEMAFYQHAQRVYSGALPVITHGGRVAVGSTPNGDAGMFWRIVSEPGLSAQFSQHRIPWWSAPWLCTDADGAGHDSEMPTDRRVERYGTEVLQRIRNAMDAEAFQQEYELRFVDTDDAFISWEEIEANVRDVPLAATWADLAALGGRLYAGVDIGRVTDASEIVVVMESLGGLKVVCIKSMVHEDFDKQEAAVMDCVRIGGVAKLCVDATGIGRQFGERLGQAFPRVATSLHYTAPLKEEMARELKRALQQGRLTLPRHRSLMEQLHAVRRTRTESGIARFDAPAAGSNHADKFWALAMAVNAAWSTGPVVTARSLR